MKQYWNQFLDKIKYLWYKYFTYITIQRTKIRPDEVLFIELHESIDSKEVFKINNYIQSSLTEDERVFVYRKPLYDIKKIRFEQDDVIIVDVDYDVYTYLKSSGEYESLLDRVSFRFDEMGIKNQIIVEPEGIEYNKTEKEILRQKLK